QLRSNNAPATQPPRAKTMVLSAIRLSHLRFGFARFGFVTTAGPSAFFRTPRSLAGMVGSSKIIHFAQLQYCLSGSLTANGKTRPDCNHFTILRYSQTHSHSLGRTDWP